MSSDEGKKHRRHGHGPAEDVDPAITAQATPTLMEIVRTRAVDARLSCEDAHAIAEEFSVPIRAVGVAAELIDIHITKCQLGCF